jgi:cation diffusion facilitator family transporter
MTPWQHDHVYGQDQKKPGEIRTLIVIFVTATTMVVEIVAGIAFGSMALLADGLHMASHATALSISFFAYVYARRHARDERFSFGTGKVNSLAGFAGAVILALFAILMVWESISRLIDPIEIAFDQALLVAVLGLLVNGASVFILGHDQVSHGEDSHDPRGEPPSSDAAGDGQLTEHAGGSHRRHHHDHNLRAAYLHVLADALTSLLAILALLAGKYLDYGWLDPFMGIVGAVLVARWSIGLLKATSRVLLDHQGPAEARVAIRESMETIAGDEVVDLHLWPVGPGHYALIVGLVTSNPLSPADYRRRLPADVVVDHVTIEVWPRGQSSA